MDKTFYLNSVLETKGLIKKDKSLKIAGYANTTDKDRAGDIIPATAWAKGVDNYRKNPVLLYQHDHAKPIGRVDKVTVDKNSFLLLIQIIIGIIGLGTGATFFVEGAKGIADALQITSLVIGMTIVALGTSLPELATSLTAAKHGETGMVIGNIIGSNIMNIVLVLGIAILFGDIPIVITEIITQVFFLVILTVSLFILFKWKDGIPKLFGIILAFIYILFIYFNF